MSWLDNIEDRVVQAYKAHNLKAVPCQLYPSAQEAYGCCALGALFWDELQNVPHDQSYAKIAELTGPYYFTFMLAFDSELRYKTTDADFPSGADPFAMAGRRTARAVKAAGLYC